MFLYLADVILYIHHGLVPVSTGYVNLKKQVADNLLSKLKLNAEDNLALAA